MPSRPTTVQTLDLNNSVLLDGGTVTVAAGALNWHGRLTVAANTRMTIPSANPGPTRWRALGQLSGRGTLTVAGTPGDDTSGSFTIGGADNLAVAADAGNIHLVTGASGTGTITVSNGASLTGNATNKFAGVIKLVDGEVQAQTDNSLGTAELDVNQSGGTATLDAVTPSSAPLSVTLSNHLVLEGGTLTVTAGVLNWHGSLSVPVNAEIAVPPSPSSKTITGLRILGPMSGAGTLTVSGTSGDDTSGHFTIGGADNVAIVADTGSELHLFAGASGKGTITVSNGASLTGNATNTFAGVINLLDGEVQAQADNSLGTAELDVNQANGTAELDAVAPGSTTMATIRLTVVLSNKLVLQGGTLTLTAGVLNWHGDVVVQRDSALDLLMLAGSHPANTNFTVFGTLSGAGTLTVSGTSNGIQGGNLSVNGALDAALVAVPNGTVFLNAGASGTGSIDVLGGALVGAGANTFAGSVVLSNGELQVQASNSLGTAELDINPSGGTPALDAVSPASAAAATRLTVTLNNNLVLKGDTVSVTAGAIVWQGNVDVSADTTLDVRAPTPPPLPLS